MRLKDVQSNIPFVDEAKTPGRYTFYLNDDNIDNVSMEQMYAVITLFSNILNTKHFRPSGVKCVDYEDVDMDDENE